MFPSTKDWIHEEGYEIKYASMNILEYTVFVQFGQMLYYNKKTS